MLDRCPLSPRTVLLKVCTPERQKQQLLGTVRNAIRGSHHRPSEWQRPQTHMTVRTTGLGPQVLSYSSKNKPMWKYSQSNVRSYSVGTEFRNAARVSSSSQRHLWKHGILFLEGILSAVEVAGGQPREQEPAETYPGIHLRFCVKRGFRLSTPCLGITELAQYPTSLVA